MEACFRGRRRQPPRVPCSWTLPPCIGLVVRQMSLIILHCKVCCILLTAGIAATMLPLYPMKATTQSEQICTCRSLHPKQKINNETHAAVSLRDNLSWQHLPLFGRLYEVRPHFGLKFAVVASGGRITGSHCSYRIANKSCTK